jgi:hypothetical protein
LLNIPLWSQTDFSTLKHISCSMYFWKTNSILTG